MRELHALPGRARPAYRPVPGDALRPVRLHRVPATQGLTFIAEKLTLEHPRSQGAGVLLL